MDFDEIKRYIEIGSGYVEVDRCYLDKYKGICRRIFIRDSKIQLDYILESWLDIEEGEETFYFCYDDTESAVKAAEKFIGKPMKDWINYNMTYNLWDFPEADENAIEQYWVDLKNHVLDFPKDFRSFYMRSYTARGIFLGLIDPRKEIDWTDELFEKINKFDRNFTEY